MMCCDPKALRERFGTDFIGTWGRERLTKEQIERIVELTTARGETPWAIGVGKTVFVVFGTEKIELGEKI